MQDQIGPTNRMESPSQSHFIGLSSGPTILL